jgi:hypothetical protein
MTIDTKKEDAAFDHAHPQMRDPKHRAEITKEVFEMAKELGIPRSTVQEAYNQGVPQIRSATAQAELYRLAKERLDDRKPNLSPREAARILLRRRGR